ncbi:hypothetical protein CPB86DRAFT_774285 [Serendipita vermifera]|nr:hypothetical protein CPB86DRAFT_774285 [Serendipita vermifera]
MASSSRALNSLEISIHRMIIGCKDEIATQADIEGINTSKEERANALNFLLSAGMVKLLQIEGSKKVVYKGIRQKEAKSKTALDKDVQSVLEQIEESKNEGIWTKAIQRRTDLPQKVVDKSLKVLEQKGLIKRIKSVKYPTRRMYMSFHLTPSEEVTGGVWYTDQEFDTAFVNILLDHIYNYIAQHSLPPPTPACLRPLYPRSEIVRFPDIRRITDWVKRSGISEVKLRESDIESLLRVLEFDGRIERIPSSLSLIEMSSDEEGGRGGKGKSKTPLKRKRVGNGMNDNDPANKWSKKAKREEYDTDDDDMALSRKNGRKDESDTDTDGGRGGSKGKKVAKRGRYSDTDEDLAGGRSRAGHSKTRSHGGYDTEEVSDDDRIGRQRSLKDASSVYRAVRPPTEDTEADGHGFSMFSGSLFGGSWVGGQGRLPWAEAPCVQCPQVDFCQETGPVNASSCHYYDQWLDPERVVQKSRSRANDAQEDNEAALAIEVESS